MKIIIFGATGFIGRNLSESLIKKGHKITVFTRYTDKAFAIFKNNVNIIEWDGVSESILSEVVSNHDAIINLAGENISSKPWTPKQKFKILQSRSQLGITITNVLNNANIKPKVFIQFSAIGYYGSKPIGNVVEEDPSGTGFLACVTRAWENSTALIKQMNIRYVVVRTGVVLGKNGGLLPRLIKPLKMYLGSYFGKGTQWVSWIHINDQIRAIEFLLENEKTEGVFNLSTPSPSRFKALIKSVGKKIKRPVWLPIPEFIIKLTMGELGREILLANQKILPSRLLKSGFKFQFNYIDDALDDLLKPLNQ